jgi:TolB-like protein/Tfp pilus assembly protein PilF
MLRAAEEIAVAPSIEDEMRMAKADSWPTIREGFQFGRFALDVRSRELYKDGSRIRLQDQPFDVLLMLLEQPGEVLTRDELRRRLWPDGTFVDFEHGLNAAVKRLRAAIGDRADKPRFIETLPRLGYRFIATVQRIEGHSEASPGGSLRQSGEKARLVVLPFHDLAGEDAVPYFSQGLTEEMIIQLGRFCSDRLAVVARTSSMLALDTAATVAALRRLLRVDYVLEGTVRKEASRVRIAAKLVETRGETQIWADTYERDLSDCFVVQAEVASSIARALALELRPEPGRATRIGTRHPEAHQAYLKGRYHWNRPGAEGVVLALSYFERALALDPGFGAAYAALGRAYVAAAEYYVREPRPSLEAGRAAAARALELDGTDSDAYLTLAEVHKSVDWDWVRAEAAYRRALSFNPSSEAAYRLYGVFLAARKRTADATLASDRACELDPLCLVVNTSAAWVRYLAGDDDGAIARCRHTLDMDDAFIPAHRLLAAALFRLGQTDEAIACLEGLPLQRGDTVALAWLIHMLGARGDKAGASVLLNQLKAVAAERYVSRYHLALAHTGLGDVDHALAFLKDASDVRDPSVVYLDVEPRFGPLRSDPRYRTLVECLGLP